MQQFGVAKGKAIPGTRWIVNVFIVFTILAVVSSNLPAESSLGATGQRWFGPYLRSAGLEQRWNVFAPDPLEYSVYLSARIRYTDGSTGSWSIPFGGKLLGAYRYYRWEKLSWRVNTNHEKSEYLREQLARWVARERSDTKRQVAEVDLVRRFADTPEPGSKAPRVWSELVFYTLRLAPPAP